MNKKYNISRICRIIGISRPTLYKYILLKDSGNKRYIPKNIIKLLDYLDSLEIIDEGVYSYVYKMFN